MLCLLLHLKANSQTWKVFGIDTTSLECTMYSHITIFNGSLWSGLLKFDGTTSTKIEAPSMLFSCEMSRADNKGNLWFVGSIPPDIWTTHGNAYVIYKYNRSGWFDYSPPKSFGYNGCNSIFFENEGKMWFTTTDSGAYMYDGTTWYHYIKPSVFEGAYSMTVDNEGNKWFATHNGLVKFDGSSWVVFNSSNSGLKFNVVNDLAVDKNGNIWLATGSPDEQGDTITGRIAKFDGTNWTYYKTFDVTQGLNYVKSIAIDSSGKIWAGTFKGLSVFDEYKWKNHNYPQSFTNNLQVNSIGFDSDGAVWLATNCGIWQLQDITASVNNSPTDNNINIYPNPANAHININLPGQIKIAEVSFLDINGSFLLKKRIDANVTQFDISNLKQGAYFIYINAELYRRIFRFVKE